MVADGQGAGLTETCSPTVRALPEVEAAAGTILDLSGDSNQAKILDKDGKAIQGNNPTFGLGIDAADERFNPFKLVEGDWATGPHQVVVDLNTADEQGFKVGEHVEVAGDGPVRAFTLTGIARFGDVNSLGGATIALFDVETARSVLRKTGFDAVAVAARDGVAAGEADRLDRARPARRPPRCGPGPSRRPRTARASASSSPSSATSCSRSAASRSSSARS